MDQDSPLVLVVDDEPPIIELLQRVGREHFPEARFISANSPQEALTYLDTPNHELPHLILLDIDLHSSVDGLELLPTIRSKTQGLTPVVMFTMSDKKPDVARAYAAGAVAYTRKPEALKEWVTYVTLLRDYWFRISILPGKV
ncbi:hypothetical protein GCM10027578_15640 [Spirosoma luteolum]